MTARRPQGLVQTRGPQTPGRSSLAARPSECPQGAPGPVNVPMAPETCAAEERVNCWRGVSRGEACVRRAQGKCLGVFPSVLVVPADAQPDAEGHRRPAAHGGHWQVDWVLAYAHKSTHDRGGRTNAPALTQRTSKASGWDVCSGTAAPFPSLGTTKPPACCPRGHLRPSPRAPRGTLRVPLFPR